VHRARLRRNTFQKQEEVNNGRNAETDA
jgi:hypothetical protein